MTSKLVVYQSNDLVMAQYKMSLNAKRIFATAIAKLNPTGETLISVFNLKDVADNVFQLNDPHAMSKFMKACDEVMDIPLRMYKDDTWYVFRFFKQVELSKKDWQIKIEFPEPIRDELLNLQSCYTSYLLNNIVHLTNPLHIRLFEILRSKSNLRKVVFTVEHLHNTLVLPDSYQHFGLMEKYFLAPARKAILANTGLKFQYKPLKLGKKVISIEFNNIGYSEDRFEEEPKQLPEPQAETVEAEEIPSPTVSKMNKDIEAVYNHYLKTFLKTPKEYRLTPNRKAKIKARLKEFSLEDLLKAIDNVTLDKWEKRPEYRDLEKHIFKSFEATEKWINFETEPKKVIPVKSATTNPANQMEDPRFQEEYNRLVDLGIEPAYALYQTKVYMRTGEKFDISPKPKDLLPF